MPVTSTGTAPASAGAKRSRAQTLLPMRFSPTKRIGSQHGPQHFQLGIAVGVLDLLGVGPFTILPDEQSQRALRRHKDDAHQDQSQAELTVDEGRRP